MAVIKERIVADQAVLKRRVGVLGVHSIDHFAFEVPDLDEARKFYETFGLDVRDEASGLGLYTFDHPHRWRLVTAGSAKRLRYLRFGIFADDIYAFDKHLHIMGYRRLPAPSAAAVYGIWFHHLDCL